MLGRLFLLFLIVPVLDLALLVAVGERLGLLPTLALVVTTAAAGSWLARREGTAAWRRVQARLAEGAVPGPELIDGLLVLVAGVLLVAPGFLTDTAGLLGLLPPTRALVRKMLSRRWTRAVAEGRIRVAGASPFAAPGSTSRPIEDAEVVAEERQEHQRVARARL